MMFYQHDHKSPSLDPILMKFNAVHTFISYLSNV